MLIHLFLDFLRRFVEKGNLEVLLFTIQSKMRANNQKPYLPQEKQLISDINRAWDGLEKAEHERELALREELIRSVTTVAEAGMGSRFQTDSNCPNNPNDV